jgi:chromosome segregation ATPase
VSTWSLDHFITDGLAVQNDSLKADIQKYIDQTNELAEQLDDAEEHVEGFRVNMAAMDQARKQINRAHMKECLARKESQKEMKSTMKRLNSLQEKIKHVDDGTRTELSADRHLPAAHMRECIARKETQKETKRLKKENIKSLLKKIEQVEERTRIELIQDRQKARRHLQVAHDEAEQLKQEINSIQEKYGGERNYFTEEQVFQFEMDNKLLQSKLNECEADKEALMEKLKKCDEENERVKCRNDRFEKLFEVCKKNPALETRILRHEEKIEASTKGELLQCKGFTDVASGGIKCKEKTLGLRGGSLCKGKTSTQGGKKPLVTKGGKREQSRGRLGV